MKDTSYDSPLSIVQILRTSWNKMQALPKKDLFFLIFLVVLLLVGNAMQIISLNFWLQHFGNKAKSGPFTTLTVSAALFGLFFFVMLVGYCIKHWSELDMRFAKTPRSIVLLTLIALFDAINSWMAIYATQYTPEVLQALFLSLQSIFTFICTKFMLKDQRNYCHPYVVVSFFVMVIGVVVASFNEFFDNDDSGNGEHMSALSRKMWSLVYFVSVPMMSIYNVLQARYMIDFTEIEDGSNAEDGGEDRVQLVSPTTMLLNAQAPPDRPRANDSIVKLVMLFADTVGQVVFIMMLLPADALPWWGRSASVSAAWGNFAAGCDCLITCDLNFVFCLGYSAGFVFTYVGSAYLNHYSATLSCMIGQLSSPLTALLLIVVPSWNVSQGTTPWYLSVVAIILLTVGTLLYSAWEQMEETAEESQALIDHEAADKNDTGTHNIGAQRNVDYGSAKF